jgi:hypothetical protein
MLWQVKKRCISNSLPFQLGKIEKLGPHNPTPRLLTGLLLALLGPPREREEAAAGPSRTGRKPPPVPSVDLFAPRRYSSTIVYSSMYVNKAGRRSLP